MSLPQAMHGALATGFGVLLDVCAAALRWGDAAVAQLHPGLFERADDGLALAQRRAVAHLCSQLPQPACRVLQVGSRTGALLRRLQAAGFDASGLAFDLNGTGRPESGAAAAPVACIVLHDALSGVQPLALFEAADRLMVRADAQMLLLDTFSLRRDRFEAAGPHHWDTFVSMARRFGWRVVFEQDLSAAAAPTFDALVALIDAHRSRLQQELQIDWDALQARVDAARHAKGALVEGRHAYRLLRLQRAAPPPMRLAAVDPSHSPAVRAMFPDRFGHELSAAEWHWKYGDGRGRGVALFQGERLVAHCGGLDRPALLMGTPVLACQIGDVMVTPEVNAGLVRTNALHQVTATFIEAHAGWGQRYVVGFGFPNSRHMKLAGRLGLYAPVDEVQQLTWAALAPSDTDDAVEPLDAATLLEDTPAWHASAALWQTMAAACVESALGVRDPAWLRHRYGRRPQCAYLLQWVIGNHAAPLGLVVLRVLPQTVELIDLVGHPRHFQRLVRRARSTAARLGRDRVLTWVTRSHAAWLSDAADPALVEQINVTVPANIHTHGVEPARLQGRWFLMGGDADFR